MSEMGIDQICNFEYIDPPWYSWNTANGGVKHKSIPWLFQIFHEPIVREDLCTLSSFIWMTPGPLINVDTDHIMPVNNCRNKFKYRIDADDVKLHVL